MKKTISLLTALLLAASLAACSSTSESANAVSAAASEAPSAAETPAESAGAAEAPAPSATESATSAPDGETFVMDTDDDAGANILVAYFSWSGNTRTVAGQIAAETGADIFEIATVDGYSRDYNTVLDEAQAEQQSNARPELAAAVENMSQYDVVFIGFPNWWGDMPMALYSFVENYDLSGKQIVPFVTSGGSGFSGSREAIAAAQPGAELLEGLSLSGDSVTENDPRVTEWLQTLGLAQ